MPVDLTPTARLVADLVAGIPDDALAGPTPCPDYTVADLLDHVGGLSLALHGAATKQPLDGSGAGDGSRLEDGWRDRIGVDVLAMAAAWDDPSAWEGMTAAGGVDLPGEIAGLVALDELVIHGWDLARAVGADYQPSVEALEAIGAFLGPATEAGDGGGIFGPRVDVPESAPLLDRTVGLTGRDPAWSPS